VKYAEIAISYVEKRTRADACDQCDEAGMTWKESTKPSSETVPWDLALAFKMGGFRLIAADHVLVLAAALGSRVIFRKPPR